MVTLLTKVSYTAIAVIYWSGYFDSVCLLLLKNNTPILVELLSKLFNILFKNTIQFSLNSNLILTTITYLLVFRDLCVWMCVSTHWCLDKCVWACTVVYKYVWICSVSVWVCTFVCVRVCALLCIWMYVSIHCCACICVWVCIAVHMDVCACMHCCVYGLMWLSDIGGSSVYVLLSLVN